MPEITFTRRAVRDIKKLPKDAQRQIDLAIDELFDDARAGDKLHAIGKDIGNYVLEIIG
ncbi:MAG: hypothetical protein HY929_00225 [Euryarchaeota archaeon]|nr:hypothetical protein [Euryarchaeota archaeon]